MSARLTVRFPGAMATLQDLGRNGLRKVGVPRSGALEPGWLRIANALVGNGEGAAAIEFFGGGLVLKAEEFPVRLALAGVFPVERVALDGSRCSITGWRSLLLHPGEQLRCGTTCGARVGYVAVAGIAAPMLLGSASSYARAGLGGMLAAGDVLLAAIAKNGPDAMLPSPPVLADAPVRVVFGPQADYFSEEAKSRFLTGCFKVTAEADRMGMRLDGATLDHLAEKGVEIASDATVPGSIQVPGNGKPIVLLNDGQTAGGYPKIATVISADLPRLALLLPGAAVRFCEVDVAEAESAARSREAALRALIGSVQPMLDSTNLDLSALYSANLVSGMVGAEPA